MVKMFIIIGLRLKTAARIARLSLNRDSYLATLLYCTGNVDMWGLGESEGAGQFASVTQRNGREY